MHGSAVAQSVHSDQRRILQEHNGLAVLDRARPDHLQRRRQRQLKYLDIFASAVSPPPADTRSCDSYSATKKCNFSVTDPGLMYASRILRGDLTLKPVSSSASRRMQVCGSSPSSNPAHASTKSPSLQPFTNVGNRNCRIKTTVECSTLNNSSTAPLPRS